MVDAYLHIEVIHWVFLHYIWGHIHLNEILGQVRPLLQGRDTLQHPFQDMVDYWLLSLYQACAERTPVRLIHTGLLSISDKQIYKCYPQSVDFKKLEKCFIFLLYFCLHTSFSF